MPRLRSNAGLYVGLGCVGLALGPLVLFALLQWAFGLFPGNNGLGLGLWAFVSGPVAVLVLVLCVLRDDRTQRVTAAKGSPSSTPLRSPGQPPAPPAS